MTSQKIQLWRLVSAGAILLISGLGIGLLRLSTPTAEAKITSHASIIPVKTQRIKAVNSYQVLQKYTGEVAPARASELGFERGGRVVWLQVDRGDRITAGNAIAKLDTSNLEAQKQELLARKAQAIAILDELKTGPRPEKIAVARAQVQDLEQQLKLENLKGQRRKNLYTEGAISREQYDEVAFNANALSRRLAAARSNLDEFLAGTRKEQIAAQQAVVKQLDASISNLEITIAKSTIKAPFSGTIAQRRLDEGTVVNTGQPVVRLVENTQTEVEIGVPVQLIDKLVPGSRQTVEIGQNTYQARVRSILPEVNPTTRTRSVILTLPDSQSQSVASGQIARLQLSQTISTNGYWLPITALVRGKRGLWSCYALIAAENNIGIKKYRVERRDVEVLYNQGDRVLVRGAIKTGDRVIPEGTQRIVNGQLVRPIEETRGRGDAGTRRRGDAETRGRGDAGTRGVRE